MEFFLDGRVVLHCGDCFDVLSTLEENSIDSCVTDPPYHLTSGNVSQDWSAYKTPKGTTNKSGRGHKTGFMGKQWDGGDIAFRPEVWRKVFRVLKPGAHLLAFGGTRTYHRMACAIEDAGFEIRDSIQWLYGSGFPKSHDVSKGIAKARDEDVEPIRVICRAIRSAMDTRGFKSRNLVQHFGDCDPRLIDHWAARDTDSQPSIPTWPQWLKLNNILSLSNENDREVLRLNGRKGEPSDNWKNADVIGNYEGEPGGFGDHRFSYRDKSIRALSAAARQWEGWGTALKPACEPIVLARKPLSEKTVAANVIKWGCGALNIDGCRVGTNEPAETRARNNGPTMGYHGCNVSFSPQGHASGRWPANVILSDDAEVVAAFPETQSGLLATHHSRGNKTESVYGKYAHNEQEQDFGGDSGSAARFFYTAKADSDDRLGSKHPTVKPLDLMQYIVRLVTPPQGTVLDLFAGTGTTGEAAFREGLNAVLIERESEYQDDIRRRMSLVLSGPDERAREAIKGRMNGRPVDPGPLFAEPQKKIEAGEATA